ncbi:uncharacterized protein BX664DRAFT_254190 [Halteromyces radiatus]|uniref:uncharacterized protein n=1 Tax=Halteromyces radiatus TaxID=101107 RepID=UPI0022208E50|nr:uncharacterized protein BX664DRAFT_254190 [Halteromyces radiatus]KAI8100166.1 hypothetical protein BX664DRAFT_254190 [Halteromyces radiatus]
MRRTSNTKLDSKRKQPKRTPIHSAATPSEYFHRNLVDAVSNVEDSDENEYYVYPYSGSEHNGNTSDHYYRPSAPRSLRSKKSNTGPQLLRSSLSSHELKQSTTQPHRPKLRSYVMDPHSAKKEYGATKHDGQWRSSRRNQSKRYLPTYQQATDGYASDDEEDSLIWHEGRRKQKRQGCAHILWTICGSILLFILICFLVIIYGGAKPLQDVTISMGRVLASDKELIFDLHVTAYNPNGWTVNVAEADISVFAFSRADPAEYLGSFYHFDEPLAFSSSILSSQPTQAVSQIRIKSPGGDQGGNERWSRIIRYSYGLLARGVLSYHSLGLPGVHSQTVAICNVAKVDPITGIVSGDPDQGYCSITT